MLGSRRRFTIGSAAAVAFEGLSITRTVAAQFEFRCGSSLPPDNPSSVRLTQMWEAIERESGGRIHTKFFPGSQLGGETGMIEQLRLGALHYMVQDGNLPTLVPAANLIFVGFAFKDADEALRAMDGPLGTFIGDEIANKGIHALRTVGSQGMNQICSNTHQIRTPDDLHGFKIRVPQAKIFLDLFRELGASPISLDSTELYSALQTKLLDGEALPSIAIENFRHFEVSKYISLTNHTASVLWLLANHDAFHRLPPDLQALVERNNTKYALLQRRDFKLVNASVENKLARQGITFNAVDQTPFRARLGGYYASWASTFGPAAWRLLQHSTGGRIG